MNPGAQVIALARELELPAPVLQALEQLVPGLPWQQLSDALTALCGPQTAQAAGEQLAAVLAPVEKDTGLAQLAAHLAAACRTRVLYREAGVPDEVFLATMGCFRRFLSETYAAGGRWVYDRAFWTWRQTACRLFRLGTLEYEYAPVRQPMPEDVAVPGDWVLFVHIPSDADLSRAALDASYADMGRFFSGPGAAFCTAGPPRAVLCGSWLLAPALGRLLDEDTGIRRFAADYSLYCVEEDDTEFYQWLFAGKRPPYPLPARTSLQRSAAAWLRAGNKIGMARGVLRRPLSF